MPLLPIPPDALASLNCCLVCNKFTFAVNPKTDRLTQGVMMMSRPVVESASGSALLHAEAATGPIGRRLHFGGLERGEAAHQEQHRGHGGQGDSQRRRFAFVKHGHGFMVRVSPPLERRSVERKARFDQNGESEFMDKYHEPKPGHRWLIRHLSIIFAIK